MPQAYSLFLMCIPFRKNFVCLRDLHGEESTVAGQETVDLWCKNIVLRQDELAVMEEKHPSMEENLPLMEENHPSMQENVAPKQQFRD